MKKLAVLVFDQVNLFETACAMEVFALQRDDIPNLYQCETVTLSHAPISTNVGMGISAKYVDSFDAYHRLIIPSWFTDHRAVPLNIKKAIMAFKQSEKPIVSFCSGAFLLASLGLLNKRKATTHWMYEAVFRERFPLVDYQSDVLYVYENNIACAAGSAAAIDLSLEIVRRDYGHEIANHIARRMVVSAQRKGYQTQYAHTPMPSPRDHFSPALDWVLENLDKPLDITDIAAKANMSRRTLDRRFQQNFKLSPKQWLTNQRILLAKRLLESTTYDMENVALNSGFINAANLRHHFRQLFGISPSQYRLQFAMKQ